MTRKEEIICAALELASEYGLKSVSLSQIADKIGIKKPSLYNHFKSKDEIVSEMYTFIREQAQRNNNSTTDYSALFESRSLEEILLFCMSCYARFLSDKNMMKFFKVLYSERSTSPAAAQIMLEETERMTSSVKNLFYALVVHGKMKNEDVDTAALTYSMTVHSLVDKQMDLITSEKRDVSEIAELSQEMRVFVAWFSKQMEVR